MTNTLAYSIASLLVLTWSALAPAGEAVSLNPTTPRASVEVVPNAQGLVPGQQAVLAVVLDIQKGFHAQSSKPLDENLIPFKVTPKAVAGITWLRPVYPKGTIENYPALGRLSVYTGRVIAFVPFRIAADLKPGPIELFGRVSYQLCDDQSCFAPEDSPFSVKTQIVAPTESPAPNQPELFKNFDPRVFADSASVSPSISPPPTPPVNRVSFAGWEFELRSDAFLLPMAIAFFIGIIFNVMPCVLPVLPLKAISFYEVAQHSRGRSVLLALVFGLGIVATFGVLAIIVLVLRTFAWGQLFSQAWFIWTVVAILLIMATGMFGAFAVQLPTSVYAVTPRHDTYGGNFLFGILTAVLATPCTAPMLPGLLIWATSQKPAVGVLAMLNVGVGMAFPYIILSAFPELARRFPRTGPFAELVKQMLGFLLLAAAAYFAGGRLIHGPAFWWLVFAVIVWAAVYLVIRTTQLTTGSTAILVVTGLSILTVAASLQFVLRITGWLDLGAGASVAGKSDGVQWQPFSADALAAARKADRLSLVKFTANWCGNCQYVELTVFHDAQAIEALRKRNVAMLKADLTQPDAAGWPLLKQLSATGGIPLTAIYVPGRDAPILIPSVYTTQTLLDILNNIPAPRSATAQR